MIAVDEKKLAEALGFGEWTEPLDNDHKRMAARDLRSCYTTENIAFGVISSWSETFMSVLLMCTRSVPGKICNA